MAEREKKRCEPEGPPAALESCAKHTAGGLARRQCLFLCSVGKTSQMPERDQISRKYARGMYCRTIHYRGVPGVDLTSEPAVNKSNGTKTSQRLLMTVTVPLFIKADR